MKEIIEWKDVAKTHGTISGIGYKNSLVNSLLCNAGKGQKYPNRIGKSGIDYYVSPKTQLAGKRALFNSLEKGNSFPVFEKLGTDKWRRLGEYTVKKKEEKADGYMLFYLTRT